MDKWERFRQLQKILEARRHPVPLATLSDLMECDPSTIKRLIKDMRDKHDAPVASSRAGYAWRPRPGQVFELPGTWLGQEELLALMVLDQALTGLGSRVMAKEFNALRKKVRELLQKDAVDGEDFIKRLRVVSSRQRQADFPFFADVVIALQKRNRLQFVYQTRSRNTQATREVSPQRLVLYRDNWYLDAWCHERQALRTFALDAISDCKVLGELAHELSEQDLNAHYTHSYGIFSGEPSGVAEIHFSAEAARWVRSEIWHAEQVIAELSDGGISLQVPYSQSIELVRDVLAWGAEAQIKAPESLRAEMTQILEKALQQYR